MSLRAHLDRSTGELLVGNREAEFRHKGTVTRFAGIRRVSVGRRGTDIQNKWIQVDYGDPAAPSTVYLNDGGWLGWRPLLTSSNKRIAEALGALASDGQA
jgi:hypothetical protein